MKLVQRHFEIHRYHAGASEPNEIFEIDPVSPALATVLMAMIPSSQDGEQLNTEQVTLINAFLAKPIVFDPAIEAIYLSESGMYDWDA